MRPTNRLFVFLSFAVFILPAAPGLAGAPFGQPFVLGVGESIVLGDDQAQLRFDGIISDSRCPVGVWCFWEGDAAADLRFSTPSGGSVDLTLHTYYGFERSATVGPFEIVLLQVLPIPVASVPIDPQSYLVQAVVYLGSVRAEQWSWGRTKLRYR